MRNAVNCVNIVFKRKTIGRIFQTKKINSYSIPLNSK